MQTLQVAITDHFPPGTRATRPSGGAVLWVELPGNIDAVDYFFRAKKAGIGIAPGPIFSTQDNYNSFIRLSCDGVWNAAMKKGIETLGTIARDMAEEKRGFDHRQG
jgi:DNA-binding transcriptional MocR family regulator